MNVLILCHTEPDHFEMNDETIDDLSHVHLDELLGHEKTVPIPNEQASDDESYRDELFVDANKTKEQKNVEHKKVVWSSKKGLTHQLKNDYDPFRRLPARPIGRPRALSLDQIGPELRRNHRRLSFSSLAVPKLPTIEEEIGFGDEIESLFD